MKSIHLMLASFLAVALSAVPAAGQEPDPKVVKRILASASSIQKDVEKLRGLKFRTDVTKGVQTRDTMKKDVIGKMRKEFGSQQMKDGVKVLRKFGFVPESFDFGEGLAQFYGSQIGGYYDPEAKRLFLIAGQAGGQAQELNDQFVMAHELGHALQDQHFDLMRYNRLFDGHDDKTMAFKALVEGEATLIGFRWLGKKSPMLGNMSIKQIFQMQKRMSGMDPNAKKLSKLPKFIVENAMFPYEEGGNFVEQIVKKGGFKAITDVFYNPPLSTEQILHPEKYMGKTKDYPLTIHMAKLSEALGKDKYRHLFRDTVGEWQTILLLKGHGISEAVARKAAAGWGGDRYQAFVHKESKRTILVWLSSWDSEKDAQEFESAYRRVLSKRYGKSGSYTLTRRGHRILLVDGANGAEHKKLTRMAWESYESRDSFKAMPRLKIIPPISDFGGKASPAAKTPAKSKNPKAKLYNTKASNVINEPTTRVRFILPDKGWKTVEEKVEVLRQFSRGRFISADGSHELRFLELPMEYDEKTMSRRLEGLVRQGIRGVKRHGQKNMKISGRSALRVDLEGTVPGDKGPSRVSVIAIDYSESTLLFLFKAPPAQWKSANGQFGKMIASLKLGRVLMTDALKKGRRIESTRTVFSLIQPKGWSRTKAQGRKVLLLKDKNGAVISASHFRSPRKTTSARLGRTIESALRYQAPGYEKVASETRKFSGQDAVVLDYKTTAKGANGRRIRHISFYLPGETELHIVINVPAGDYDDRYGSLVDGLIDTLEVLNPEADAPKLRMLVAPKNKSALTKKAQKASNKARLY
jgi:hypothetical protein